MLSGDLAGPLAGDLSGSSGARVLALLDQYAIEHWDVARNVGLVSGRANTWTGQRAGYVLSAVSAGTRPSWGASGARFGGRNVIKTDAGASELLRLVAGAPFVLTGQRPFLYIVTAQPALYTAAGTGYSAVMSDLAAQELGYAVGSNGAGSDDVLAYAFPQGNAEYNDGQDTQAHVWFATFRAGDLTVLTRDGVEVASAAGGALERDLHTLGIGGRADAHPALFASTHVAAVGICSAEPPPAVRAALYSTLRSAWL